MLFKHSSDVPADIVSAGTGTTRQVLIGPDEGPNFAMRRFIMEPGGGMPKHTNTIEHEQYVLRGAATIGIGDDTIEVRQGDVLDRLREMPDESLTILRNSKHRRRRLVPPRVRNHRWLTVLHHGHARIRRSQINPNYSAHAIPRCAWLRVPIRTEANALCASRFSSSNFNAVSKSPTAASRSPCSR